MGSKLTSSQCEKLAHWYDAIAADYRAAAELPRNARNGGYRGTQLLLAEQAEQRARNYRARAHGRRKKKTLTKGAR